jgi:hypothetical protein
MQGGAVARSSSNSQHDSPIIRDGRVTNTLRLGAAQDGGSVTNSNAHTDTRTETQNQSESQGGSLGRTISRMLSKARSLSTSHSHTEGGSRGEGLTISQKWVHLARVIREEQLTGSLQKSVSDQLEQIVQMISTLERRQALVKRPGESRSVLIETTEVNDPFVSPEALVRAIEWMKRELAQVHDYYFVPNLEDEGRSLAEFLGEADEPVVVEEFEEAEEAEREESPML